MSVTGTSSRHSGVATDTEASKPISGTLKCRVGDCTRIIKGIESGEFSVHPDGKVTLLSHEKGKEKIAEYQEMLKERPDCSTTGYWKEGLSAAAKDFDITEKVVGGVIKGMDHLYGTIGRGFGYLVSAGVESEEKTVQRITEDTFEILAPEEASKVIRKANLVILASDLSHAAFTGMDAMWDHDRRCADFSAIEGRIAQVEEASTEPIAWIEPSSAEPSMDPNKVQVQQIRPSKEDLPKELRGKPSMPVEEEDRKDSAIVPSQTGDEEKINTQTVPESKNETLVGDEERAETQPVPESENEILDDLEVSASVILTPNISHIEESRIGVEIDFGEGASVGAVIQPMKIENSTIVVQSQITEEVGTSIAISPADFKESVVRTTFKTDSFMAGMSSSLNGKLKRVTIGGKIKGFDAAVSFDAKRPFKRVIHLEGGQEINSMPYRASVDLNTRKFSKTVVKGEVVAVVYFVPVKAGGKIKLGKPQDAQVKVSLPTGFFGEMLPKGLKFGDIPILSLNFRKIRHGVQKVLGIGSSKKKRKAQRRAQRQIAAVEAELERARKVREQWFSELVNWTIQDVDDQYAPILAKEIGELNRALEQFMEEFTDLPVLELEDLEREGLTLNIDGLIWDEAKWEEFFTNATLALFEMNEENEAIIHLLDQVEEVSNNLRCCQEEMDRVTDQYQETKETFEETERLVQTLVNNEQVLARLRDNIPAELLPKTAAVLSKST